MSGNATVRLLVGGIFAILASLPQPVRSLELVSGEHYRHLVGALTAEVSKLDTTSSPKSIHARVPENFHAIEQGQIDFGFTEGTVWLYLPLRNTSARESDWILALNTRFMNELVVHIKEDGEWNLLLENSARSHFAERPLNYRLLGVEFSLKAQQSAELLIGYRSRGTTYLPISLETPQSFADARAIANTKSGGFYTAAMLMLLYGLFQMLLPGNRIYLHYVAYLTAAMLYVFHMDGLSFQYLWPGLPNWNAFASLPLGLLINILAANFSRNFLETWRTAPRFDMAILAMIGLSVLAILSGILIEDLYIKRASFWLTTAGTLLYLSAGIYALIQGQRSARFYVAGWLGICSAAFISSLIHSLPGALPVSLSFDITKGGILFDALMFGMAMADRANQVRQERDDAQRREMQALAAQSQARSALAAANRGKADALRIAQQKDLQLATASHDIRQPLSSLKMALSTLQDPREKSANHDNSRAALDSVEYLDALVTNYLDSTREEYAAAPLADEQLSHRERFPIQVILDGISQMFTADAAEKNSALHCRPSSMLVYGEPVATMRIVSNLVTNAIVHTDSGHILVGCRRRPGHCELWVADSGGGLAPGEEKRILSPFQQGDEEEKGYGLGMHIVASLCKTCGYNFTISNSPDLGVTMKVSIPR